MFNEDVLELKDDNLEDNIKKYDYLFVIFYAPWCGHCKAFAPEFSAAATELKKNEIYFGKIDATVNEKTSNKYNIDGFPTVFFFIKGQAIRYEGGRKKPEVIEWIYKKIRAILIKLNKLEYLEKVKNEDKICVVYFGEDKEDIKILSRLLYNFEFKFYVINVKESYEKYKVKEGSVILFKDFDDLQSIYSGKITEENLKEFISTNSVPLVIPLIEKNVDLVSQKDCLIYVTTTELAKEQLDFLKKLSKKYNKVLLFSTLVSNEQDEFSKSVVEQLHIDKFPAIRILKIEDDHLYFFQGEINEKTIVDFIENFIGGKLKRYYESEKIPDKQNKEVFVLVGFSFKKEVIDNKKDVLVLFYQEEGDQNEEMKKIYYEYAKKLNNTKSNNLIISEFNYMSNECEEVELLEFEEDCIYLYPGDKKDKPIKYEGKPDLEKLEKFVKDNSFNKEIKKEDL